MKNWDDVERLAGTEQLAGERSADELRACATRTVHHEHGVPDDPLRILLRRTGTSGSGS